MTATLKDVARKAGVSPIIVSQKSFVPHFSVQKWDKTFLDRYTVALSNYKLGRRAAQILLECIQTSDDLGAEFQQILLEPHLIVRASCDGALG